MTYPGWYYDEAGRVRWWNGNGWADPTSAPLPTVPPPAPPVASVPPPAPGRPTWTNGVIITGIAVTVLAVVAAIVFYAVSSPSETRTTTANATTSTTTVSTHTITGELVLSDTDSYDAGCTGRGGYDDIYEGADITIRDASNTIVSIGTLGAPTAKRYGACSFPITVNNVPDAPFYTSQIGSEKRGHVNWTREELDGTGWVMSITLGND